jgi:NADH-quinone oxidoreductase subunit G
MALIRIDDREIEVAQGETLLRAALNNGIYIPYYCWHPALSVVGQCRICLVEVKGAPKLLTACSTTVVPLPPDKKIQGKYDMVVETKNELVKKAQRGVLEFLLLNHPLDCPICDQAGECQLQNYAYTYGSGQSRFDFEKLHAPKRVDLGPHVVFDVERCIKCTRCIRFCNEITKTGELTLTERGAHARVDVFPGRQLDNPYSVCTVDVCPVGALTSKEFRFKERVWFLTSANSVCPECARGCAVRFDTYKGEVLRLVPRDNPKVNGPWMCDYGRLLSERLKEAPPAGRPLVRGPEGWSPLLWERLAPLLVEKFRPFSEAEAGRLEVLLSGRMTLEEMAAFRKLSETLLGGASGTALNATRGEDDQLLIRRERRPNLKGAELMGLPIAPENAPVSKLLAGKKAALILREDVVGDAEGSEKQALTKLFSEMDLVVVADCTFTETASLAHLFIPLTGWHEMEGTTVNFLGVAQKTARAVHPPKQRRTFYEAVSLWLAAAGCEAPAPDFLGWHAVVKGAVTGLKDVSIRDLLPNGIQIGEVKP